MNALSLFNSLFDDAAYGTLPAFAQAASAPRVDVSERKDSYELDMELPGLTEKDVEIELKDKVLTISSAKSESREEKQEKDENERAWLVKERRSYSFSRRFSLPQDIDEEAVSAAFKNGILTVKIPRKALAAPKRIAISAA